MEISLEARKELEKISDAFVGLGLQYYVAARSAAWAGLMPVFGNLYHHALEMLLKAGLSQYHSLKKLSKPPFSHNLLNLWDSFKVSFPSTELPQFDATIVDINDFEEIRYPDKVLKNGAEMRIEFVAHPAEMIALSSQLGVSKPIDVNQQYLLYPPDVDRLILEICHALSLNPKVFASVFKPDVRKMLADFNPVSAELLF
jgi:hypothetical protein